jgi:hypothetical protein
MALTNFRDLSTSRSGPGAGFQFEFRCQSCARTWKSRFKPYKPGALTALAGRLSVWVSMRPGATPPAPDLLDDPRARRAREVALDEAAVQAERLYHVCADCQHAVCADCWDAAQGVCTACANRAIHQVRSDEAGRSAHPSLACPNCRAPSTGGRFCGGCGYDMAITHKTCPACGTMLTRQARFCTECGHGF